ncbi:MAG: sulfatase-like hydrolase/transferase [Oscillospiraceae bacterium]|nr:sulfatase-like hydrolase/transferase [Oscillospiraceae bacterium]
MINRIKNIRINNKGKHKSLKKAVAILFPLFLVFLTESVHTNSLSKILAFTVNNPKTIIFSFLVVSMIYTALVSLTRSVTWAAAVSSLLFFTFAVVEYFKFKSSGTHFNISDLKMSATAGNMSDFAVIRPTAGMIIGGLLLFSYIFLIFLLNIKINVKRFLAVCSSFSIAMIFMFFIAIEPVYGLVYTIFEISTEDDNNVFLSREIFTENKLIANLTQSLSREFSRLTKTPENYSFEKVSQYLSGNRNKKTPRKSDDVQPNVIVIMSESFADMRLIDGIYVPDGVYDDFDELKTYGFSGMSFVPAFGGNTVKTEFELLFGLPLKSLGNAPIPPSLIEVDGETEETFAKLYSTAGYSAFYIHPFKAGFYNRDKVYSEFGFDRLIFDEDLTTDITYFGNYIDDETVFKQIQSILEGQSADYKPNSPSYIFATTMQNHMPYINEDFDGSELDYYFSGIKQTSHALFEFYEYIMTFEEPTTVLFVGDHYPSFSTDSSAYVAADITAENCYEFYIQPYLVLSNFDIDYGVFPEDCVSAFYLPHLLISAIGLPTDDFIDTFLSMVEHTPVYTDVGLFLPQNEKFDMLTYDRTRGHRYSVYD